MFISHGLFDGYLWVRNIFLRIPVSSILAIRGAHNFLLFSIKLYRVNKYMKISGIHSS